MRGLFVMGGVDRQAEMIAPDESESGIFTIESGNLHKLLFRFATRSHNEIKRSKV